MKNFGRILLGVSAIVLIFISCSTTKNVAEQDETEDTYVIGKYAGVPPQYREILQEQEEKNAAVAN
ncbi:MAG: hypothetical protein MJ188_09910 [Treponema sp.]|nr:hypothetical protein [Treponema sp.]